MNEQKFEKLLFLLKEMLPEDKQHLIEEIGDENISVEKFKFNCRLAHMSPEEREKQLRLLELEEKFKDYKIISKEDWLDIFKNKYPDGLSFNLNNIGSRQLYNLIKESSFCDVTYFTPEVGDKKPSLNGLQATFSLSPDEYGVLEASFIYEDKELEEYLSLKNLNEFEFVQTNMSAYHLHPDGEGIVMYFDEWEIFDHLKIEGQPLDKVKAVLLQFPDLDDDNIKQLLDNPQLLGERLQEVKDSSHENGYRMSVGEEHLYFYEPGKLGYMVADEFRHIKVFGEPLKEDNKEAIADFVSNGNLVVSNPRRRWCDFFQAEAEASEERKIFMEKNTGNYGVAVERINPDGQIFYKVGGKIHEKESLKDWVDITGRVTDVVMLNGNVPQIRCKIDGEQQLSVPLSWADREQLREIGMTKEEREKILFGLAVARYKDQLTGSGPKMGRIL